ncbi:hypothetical protein [Mycobacterium intracellulare]|uniref:hypothetical protein n=1 Tax=Mycobacterium intracellulare TaxID=1767 RepID=UPI0012BCE585|nr:hypothetical protein [Mycobacterium intracellulare]
MSGSDDEGNSSESDYRDAENHPDSEFDLGEFDRQPARVVAPEIAALRREVDLLSAVLTVFVVVVVFLCCWVTVAPMGGRDDAGRQAAPSELDQAEADLLKVGLHCFSGPAELGAARQRALAAIDRYRWQDRFEREQRVNSGRDSRMLGGSPSRPEGHLSIGKPPGDKDASKCFDIELPPWGGPYLPFGT